MSPLSLFLSGLEGPCRCPFVPAKALPSPPHPQTRASLGEGVRGGMPGGFVINAWSCLGSGRRERQGDGGEALDGFSPLHLVAVVFSIEGTVALGGRGLPGSLFKAWTCQNTLQHPLTGATALVWLEEGRALSRVERGIRTSERGACLWGLLPREADGSLGSASARPGPPHLRSHACKATPQT